MVTFTCLRCNESLKKSTVARHLTMCRKPVQLTCIDCLKDFTDVTYVEHTQCITENEKYGGAGYVAKLVAKKQTSWLDVIRTCSQKSNLTAIQKDIFYILADTPNVPRKLVPFKNFWRGNRLLRTYNQYILEEVFNILTEEWNNSRTNNSEGTKSQEKKGNQSQTDNKKTTCEVDTSEQNGNSEKKKKKKKKKGKRKHEVLEDEQSANMNGDHDLSLNGNESPEKTKKKKKNKKSRDETLDDSNAQMEDQADSMPAEGSTVEPTSVPQDMSHLSKKERKKLLKQMKYEAELKEIETEVKETDTIENGEEAENKEKVKKDKKSKKRKADVDDKAVPLENNHEPTEAKKQKLNENDNTDAPPVPETSGKFDWQDVITRVLQSSDDNELSLKRLYKKVINEYYSQCGEREEYEKLLGKCSKKVQKIPGIRVLKDRAKLVPTK